MRKQIKPTLLSVDYDVLPNPTASWPRSNKQCKAQTKRWSRRRCSNSALKGSDYCGIHEKSLGVKKARKVALPQDEMDAAVKKWMAYLK